MAESIKVHLGGCDFVVRPLTFRQLREIEGALGRAAAAGSVGKIDFDASVDILVAALGRSEPAMDREAILDLEGAKADFVAATRAVLTLSGYIERKDPAPGEAQAGN